MTGKTSFRTTLVDLLARHNIKIGQNCQLTFDLLATKSKWLHVNQRFCDILFIFWYDGILSLVNRYVATHQNIGPSDSLHYMSLVPTHRFQCFICIITYFRDHIYNLNFWIVWLLLLSYFHMSLALHIFSNMLVLL